MAKKAFIVGLAANLEHGVVDPKNPRAALKDENGAPVVLKLDKGEELEIHPSWAHEVKGLVAAGFVKVVAAAADDDSEAKAKAEAEAKAKAEAEAKAKAGKL